MNLEVGDRVTYKDMGITRITLIENDRDIEDIKECVQSNAIQIIKIERPHYEVIEEKKELLTDEEKEFLKNICKYYNNISQIFLDLGGIRLCDTNCYVINSLDYPDNMTFANIKKEHYYTLKELGLEEK